MYPNPSNANAHVYFQNLIVTPTGELGKIDMARSVTSGPCRTASRPSTCRNFYLAHTETTKPSTPSSDPSTLDHGHVAAGAIDIPQGVNTLRFGGVNVNYTPSGGTPLNQTGQSNEFQINLGLPIVQGTSIIVNTVNSNARSQFDRGAAPFQDLRDIPGHRPAEPFPGQ